MHRLFFQNLIPGTLLFNRYQLVRCLAARHDTGVYLCRDELDGRRQVVVKVLSVDDGGDQTSARRLEREATLSRQVQHRHVLSPREFHRDDTFAALVLEYADGGTLRKELSDGPIQSLSRAVKVAEQISSGLEAIHGAGILHRDLKPDNVLTYGDGSVRITDFGIACTRETPVTYHGRGMTGTFDYLSPEYLEFGQWDERADIYALGVVTYQMITGTLPFPPAPFYEATKVRISTDPDPPGKIRENVPGMLDEITLKALARNPRDRFQSAEELRRVLSEVVAPLPPLIEQVRSNFLW